MVLKIQVQQKMLSKILKTEKKNLNKKWKHSNKRSKKLMMKYLIQKN